MGTSGSNAYYVPDWSKDVSFAGLKCRYTMQDYNFADDLKCTGVSNDVVRPTVSYSDHFFTIISNITALSNCSVLQYINIAWKARNI